MSRPPKNGEISDPDYSLRTLFCGFCMGLADVVPGVSGGTLALILGIYQRLVAEISRFDSHFIGLLRKRSWAQAATYLDIRFLLTLLAGIALGIVVAVLTISRLLQGPTTRPFVLAAFCGLVAGSIWIVAEKTFRKTGHRQRWSVFGLNPIAFVAGGITAAAISLVNPVPPGENVPLVYVFFSATLSICAMILPGISGALILLLLGAYDYVIDALKSLLMFDSIEVHLPVVAVFIAGCLVGLLSFSKMLKWLLAHRYAATMSSLCGLMAGSLVKIWPFQTDLTPEISEFKHKQFWPRLPDAADSTTLFLIFTMLMACSFVLMLRLFSKPPPSRAER